MGKICSFEDARKAKRDAHLPSVPPKVTDSPIGSGVLTGFSDAGYPRVNDVSVVWCELEGGGRIGYRPGDGA